jgi:hypothetical protein
MTGAPIALAFAAVLFGSAQTPASSNAAVAGALLPLPEPLRAGATVVRLDAAFRPSVLRKGTNAMVCIADTPNDDRFDVRCYKDTFIPVVYRAFQLGYQVSGENVEAEIKAGKLPLPNEPTAGYRCLGPISGYDAASHTVNAQIECWQSIHFPFRTAAELGVPDERDVSAAQQREVPYVMSSGKYWSHVMIRHPATHDH